MVEPDFRTEEHVTEILQHVRGVRFFEKLTEAEIRAMCRRMTLETFEARELIIKHGDVGNKGYVILSGSVAVQIPSSNALCPRGIHPEKCTCPDRALETVVFLEKGSGFGELALQTDQLRSATIQASEPTETLAVTREDYEKIAGTQHKQFMEQRVDFLRGCPRIGEALEQGIIALQELAVMASCLNERSLSGSEMVVHQGNHADQIIFVRSGRLAVLRCIDLDACRAEQAKLGNKNQLQSSTTTGQMAFTGVESQNRTLSINLAKSIGDMKRQQREAAYDALNNRLSLTQTLQLPGAKKAFTEQFHVPLQQAARTSSMPASNAIQSKTLTMQSNSESEDESREDHAGRWKPPTAATQQALVGNAFRNAKLPSVGTTAKDAQKPILAKSIAEGAKSTQQHIQSQGRKSLLDEGKTSRKKFLLRIGTVSAYQSFGDQQVCTGQEVYPGSLVCDPIAEIFTLSKNDILRRLPKRLYNALFTYKVGEADNPPDYLLFEMLQQTERFNKYSHSLVNEAMRKQSQTHSFQQSSRQSWQSGRVDAVANLQFLGIDPSSPLGQKLLVTPEKRALSARGKALSQTDQQHFSQSDARFLRKVDIIGRDPRLQASLIASGHRGQIRNAEGLDPNAFHFEQGWLNLRKNPISLDFGDDDLDNPKHLRPSTAPWHAPAASPQARCSDTEADRPWRTNGRPVSSASSGVHPAAHGQGRYSPHTSGLPAIEEVGTLSALNATVSTPVTPPTIATHHNRRSVAFT